MTNMVMQKHWRLIRCRNHFRPGPFHGFLEAGAAAGDLRNSCGYSSVPRVRTPTGTQISGVSGPSAHPALREGRVTRLISLVNRAMVIVKLTHLHIAIPSSGNPPGEVPNDSFPRVDDTGIRKTPRRVSFAPVCQTSTGEPTL